MDITLLGGAALKSHAFAKCLHYKEMAFQGMQRLQNDSGQVSKLVVKLSGGESSGSQVQVLALEECVDELISVNNHLNLPEAATGVLEFSAVAQKPALLEKLGRWEKANEMYDAIVEALERSPVQPPEKDGDDSGSEDEDDFDDDEDDLDLEDFVHQLDQQQPSANSKSPASVGVGALPPSSVTAATTQGERYAVWRKQIAEAKLGKLRYAPAM